MTDWQDHSRSAAERTLAGGQSARLRRQEAAGTPGGPGRSDAGAPGPMPAARGRATRARARTGSEPASGAERDPALHM